MTPMWFQSIQHYIPPVLFATLVVMFIVCGKYPLIRLKLFRFMGVSKKRRKIE